MASVTLDKVARTMPPTGADVVLRTWRAWEERDMDTVVDGMRPDVVHDLSHYEGFPGEPVNAGIGPALDSLAVWMAWWRGYRQELIDTEETPGHVLLHVRHRGERDGREIDEPIALLFHLDDAQRITRWAPWSDVDAARAAMRA
jgi:ketosteroid isomerase-like protein